MDLHHSGSVEQAEFADTARAKMFFILTTNITGFLAAAIMRFINAKAAGKRCMSSYRIKEATEA